MVGEIVETKDYSTKDHRMQTAHQNTYFLERYGRNDFQALGSPMEVQHSLGYLMKYIEKSGERLIYGGGLPTYFVSDVMDEDVICPYGIDDRKAILADNFTCISAGEIMGTVSKEVIEKMPNKAIKSAKKTLQTKQKRAEELSRLIQVAYEDRVKGNMPEDICFGLIEKYSTEQKSLTAEIEEIETKMKDTETTLQSADAFIHNIKKYLEAPELTREMCYELLDRVIVGGHPKITGKEREIDIVYKVDITSVLRHKFNNADK